MNRMHRVNVYTNVVIVSSLDDLLAKFFPGTGFGMDTDRGTGRGTGFGMMGGARAGTCAAASPVRDARPRIMAPILVVLLRYRAKDLTSKLLLRKGITLSCSRF